MSRLGPKSLAGQMALLLGLALLVAQIANFALVLNERQRLSLAENQGPAITRFADLAADVGQASPDQRGQHLEQRSHRGVRFMLQTDSGIPEAARRPEIEAQLAKALKSEGAPFLAVRATTEPAGALGRRGGRAPPDVQITRLAVQLPDGGWLVGRVTTPRRDPWLMARLGAATGLLYLIVLGASLWIALRLARPLGALTRAAEAFGGRSEPPLVIPAGPDDLRRAIEAFNAMNRRVATLLDEKDRMLGAIGHDLRTPLASLRIRIESMDPAEDRTAAIAKIEEMTRTLEDILVLARTGRIRGELRATDVSALAEAVAYDHAALGQPVRFEELPRAVAAVEPSLLRRAIGNLVDNAVKYGGGATVSVAAASGGVEIRVEDHGPGIPAEQIEQALQPFHRLENSRNRETGGAGLGLAIAQSIAESHDGRLKLEPREPRGLRASLFLPA